MKLKIDENLSLVHRRILEAAGHDVADVHDEGLAGASDDVLWSHVCVEGRFLVTLTGRPCGGRHNETDLARGFPRFHQRW